jgi:predicted Zn-dependent protease
MQDYFHSVADRLTARLRGDEIFTCHLSSEQSDFARFNGAALRQVGAVAQQRLRLDWIKGQRQATGWATLAGDPSQDEPRLERLVGQLRGALSVLPDDPHLLHASEVRSTERIRPNELPPAEQAVEEILSAAGNRDLVGIYASGGRYFGFANSLGQRNWYANHSFNLDWSFHHTADKAVKGNYAGTEWRASQLGRRFERAAEELHALRQPERTIEPGHYRVYLAPAALLDIFDILAWGGFGLRAQRTRTTPLLRLAEGQVELHPSIEIVENTAEGIGADFQAQGFIRPDSVTLVAGGRHRDSLVSPRSAAEYEVPTNGANDSESPESIDLRAGTLDADRILNELDTGIYVSNLWYLNYSDRRACRTTGMTRFATFWVERGRVVAPLAVMRFDESVYRMLGENLIGLTSEREVLLDTDTYDSRSTRSARRRGALVVDFHFAL